MVEVGLPVLNRDGLSNRDWCVISRRTGTVGEPV